jgi:outer membrane biosynthesis protein TonB
MSASTPVSASTGPVVANVTTEIKEKKPRTPTLPAKFGKFIQFGYWLIQSFKDDEGNFSVDSEDEFIEAIHLYDSVDAQQEFVQDFFDESKDIAKNIRKMILDKKRAEAKAAKAAEKAAAKPPKEPKAPKEKKVKEAKAVKEPKEKVVKEPKEKVVKEPKEKAPKKTKEVKVPVVTEQVVVEETVLQPVVVDQKPKKGKAKKATVDDQFVSEVVSLANAVVTTNDEKPKRKYTKKSNALQTTPNDHHNDHHYDNDNDNDNEPQLAVDVFDFQGKQFLIDDQQRVFDFHSHNLIGHFLHDNIVPI